MYHGEESVVSGTNVNARASLLPVRTWHGGIVASNGLLRWYGKEHLRIEYKGIVEIVLWHQDQIDVSQMMLSGLRC